MGEIDALGVLKLARAEAVERDVSDDGTQSFCAVRDLLIIRSQG